MDFCRGYSVEKQLIEAYEDYTTYLFLSFLPHKVHCFLLVP